MTHEGPRFEEHRLDVLRDAVAALRAFEGKDFELSRDITRRYWGDESAEAELAREMIEVVSGLLSTADDFGLPADDLVAHLIEQVPDDLTETYKLTGRLLLAVHDEEPSEQEIDFVTFEDYDRFVKALFNSGSYLAREVGKVAGIGAEEVLGNLAASLATE